MSAPIDIIDAIDCLEDILLLLKSLKNYIDRAIDELISGQLSLVHLPKQIDEVMIDWQDLLNLYGKSE